MNRPWRDPLTPDSDKLPAMADKDADEPSLELPSFGFGRKRRGKSGDPESRPETPAQPESPPEAPAQPGSQPEVPAQPESQPESRPGPGSTAETRRLAPAAPPPAATPLPADDAADTRVDTAPTPVEEESRGFSLPRVGGLAASIITGVLVGVLMVGLTWAGFRLCEVVRGTSSCGDPGFLLLLAILLVAVFLGAALLRAWGVGEPGSTSLLAVGLLAVLALLFLVDVLFAWWMVIVIPALAAATYALSYRLTTAFAEPADR